ncbi:MAG TPA: pyrimidine dimer DNA glycosylase/endonuclease V [Gemmatimonadales bacterium]|nr:pyrimidine dimer DNA glycosylase/endonuclease V [Gemmatimonadales bacterium]
MRLWTLHPQYLDARGLVAVWREALLARAVLRGKTAGYRHHPQLLRFRAAPKPVQALNAYLAAIHLEASKRGYRFDRRKLGSYPAALSLPATRGQLAYEWAHLRRKLRRRNPAWLRTLERVSVPRAHPLFRITRGPVASWERLPD